MLKENDMNIIIKSKNGEDYVKPSEEIKIEIDEIPVPVLKTSWSKGNTSEYSKLDRLLIEEYEDLLSRETTI